VEVHKQMKELATSKATTLGSLVSELWNNGQKDRNLSKIRSAKLSNKLNILKHQFHSDLKQIKEALTDIKDEFNRLKERSR
jgi:archaellum component FlaC